jgi:hypothetical protein
MINVPDNIVAELTRHLPLILQNMPQVKSLRVLNAIRMTKINIKKLNKLKLKKDGENNRNQTK